MPAGLEIDDVAVAVGDEAPVGHDMHHASLVKSRERPFASRVLVRAIEEPAPARIAERSRKDHHYAIRSFADTVALDAFAAKLRDDARSRVAHALCVPCVQAF